MKNQIHLITYKHRNKHAVIDTNLLLVYLVGCIDTQLIATFKRTNSRYRVEDFKILDDLVSKFDNIVTTPNILTEVSNLGGQLDKKKKPLFFSLLSQFIDRAKEIYIQSSEISKDDLFIKLGITDRGLFELDKSKYIIISDDYKLCSYCNNKGLYSINFNHARDYVNY